MSDEVKELGLVTWKSLWKIKHQIFPWAVSNNPDPILARDERVESFYNVVVNPALDKDQPLNILLPNSIWKELIEEGAIKEYFVPSTQEIQVNTGLLGTVGVISFWSDAFTDEKARDANGKTLEETLQYAIIDEEKEVNTATQIAPAIGEMLTAPVNTTPNAAVAGDQSQDTTMGELFENMGSVSAVEDVSVSFVFGEKKDKEIKAHRSVLNAHFASIEWQKTIGTSKKSKDVVNQVLVFFSANSIASEYDNLLLAASALVEQGSFKVVMKESEESKKTVAVTIKRCEVSGSLNKEAQNQRVTVCIEGETED